MDGGCCARACAFIILKNRVVVRRLLISGQVFPALHPRFTPKLFILPEASVFSGRCVALNPFPVENEASVSFSLTQS